MAEIIDAEKIRQKLKEFDSYIQQNVDILKTLKVIKDDAEKMFLDLQGKDKFVSQIEENLKKLQEDAESITEILSRFKESKGKEITDFINKYKQETETITVFIDDKKQEIEDFLLETQQQQSQLIKIKLYEMKAEIKTFKEQNSQDIANFINKCATEVDERFSKINNENENFKAQIKETVASSRKDNEKQISDFLYKQNALVSNLNQQIDSYQKLMEVLQGTIGKQGAEIEKLKTVLDEYPKQMQSLNSQNVDFKNRLDEIEKEVKKPLVKKLFGGK